MKRRELFWVLVLSMLMGHGIGYVTGRFHVWQNGWLAGELFCTEYYRMKPGE